MSDPRTEDFFVVNNEDSFGKLRKWLRTRVYNDVVFGLFDKVGNPLIGLRMDHNIGAEWSKNKLDKRGLICVRDRKLLNDVKAICEKEATP